MKILILLFLFPFICSAQTVKVYPAITGHTSSYYTVLINGSNSPVLQANAGNCPSTQCLVQHKDNIANLTTFSSDFAGTVSVTVTKLGSSATYANVRPNALGIGKLTATVSGGNSSVTFNLTHRAKVSVEFSDDTVNYVKKLFVSADPLETNVPDTTDVTHVKRISDSASLRSIAAGITTVYFRPGIYRIGQWTIPSGITHIYIAGGAYVQGYFLYAHSPLLTVNGRGIITANSYVYHYPNPGSGSSANWNYLFYQQGGSVSIYGISFVNPSAFTIVSSGTSLIVDDINLIGPFYNNDGTTNYATTTVIRNSLYLDEDDAWILKNGGFTAYNNTIWQTQGGIVKVGFIPLSLNGVTVTKTYVLHDQNPSTDTNQGFITADYGGNSTLPAIVQNFTIDTAYFDTPVRSIVNIQNDKHPGVVQAPWIFSNWTFKHIFISQSTYSFPMFYIHGYNACFPSYNFTFSNVTLNGSTAPLSNSAFFSTKNYNISPFCGGSGFKVHISAKVKN